MTAKGSTSAAPLGAADLRASTQITSREELWTIVVITVQLALALLIVHAFQLESRTFFHVMVLAAVGFPFHALLPARLRLPMFALLSLASIVVAFGARDGFFLIMLGLVLIGLCHLPVPMAVRVPLLLVTAALFAVWRMELLPAPWSVAIWPILASMFMFRLALYLHALKHDGQRPTPARTLAYFFMLPNTCFPLFPVVDYTTFTNTYFDRGATQIYETGMRWIARGLFHLILYRFVYLHLAGDPTALHTLGDLVQFLLATFLLYLRVSGQFHLITGTLHLFGFRLPETHHLYYLSSSFTDFWRRINIYWKDFMMKLVYYPSYFWWRRWGGTTAIVAATITVFLLTWLLHSYQWFWLRGGFPLAPQDGLFWAILAVLVVQGSLRELKQPRRRTLGRGPAWSASLAVRTVATFTVICVLWSLWSTESVAAWLMIWLAAGNVAPGDLWLLGVLVLGGLLVAGRAWSVHPTPDASPHPFYRRPALQSTALLVGLLVVGTTDLYAWSSPRLAAVVASLQRSTLSARDAALKHRGYYENLDNASRMSANLWSVQAARPRHWVGLSSTAAWRRRDDFLGGDLQPGARIVFNDQPLTVNRWGMRDRDRALEKPKHTYRIAVLGPSHVMGSAVADGDTFSDALERRLNREADQKSTIRYEVLNFGVAGFSLVQQLAMLEERALQFRPDAVFITDSSGLNGPILPHLINVVASRTTIPYPELEAIIGQTGVRALAGDGVPAPFHSVRSLLNAAGVRTRMPFHEANHRLRLSIDDVRRWTLRRLAEVTRQHGAVPVFVALDNVLESPAVHRGVLEEAAAAGFIVFNLLDVWQGREKDSLRIGAWDDHPNAAGYRVVAEHLVTLMQQSRAELRLTEGLRDVPGSP